MPTTAERLLRDHVRYTGDGKPNEPVGAPLPVGDPRSGVHQPTKKDFRDAIGSVTDAADAANEAAEAANNAADRVEAYMDRDIFMVFIGQSNARSVSDQNSGYRPTPSPAVKVWNSQAAPSANGTAWVTATLGQAPFVGGAAVNNLAYQAAHELHERTGKRVFLLLVALGSHHIEAFMNSADLTNNGWAQTPGEADLFTFLMAQTAPAMSAMPGTVTSADVFCIHQGEENKTDQAEVYANKMRILLKRFELNGLIVRNKTDVVAGEILSGAKNGRYRDRHSAALNFMQMGTRQDAFPRFKIAHSQGLQPVTLIDDLHFSGEDLVAMGKRYVDAMFTEQVPPDLDPRICDMSVDGGLGWGTGMVAAQTHVTYDRREPYNLDAMPFTIEDNATIGWCYVGAQNTVSRIASRKLFQAAPGAILNIGLELRNDHPSAAATFQVGAQLFGVNKNYLSQPTYDIAVAANTTVRRSVSIAILGTTADLSLSQLTRWFSFMFTTNPSGTGATLKWNCTGVW